MFTPKCGTHYTRDEFKGCRGKLMSETIEAKVIAGRFAFHDLRAYYAPTSERARRPARPACEPCDNRTVYDRNKIGKRCEFHFVECQNKNGTVFWDSAVFNNLILLGILWGG